MDLILKRTEGTESDNLNLFNEYEIPDPDTKIWI